MRTNNIRRECKRCGLLESTVLATETKCIPDRRMGTILEGVHDFISECGCSTKYCKHYKSDFDKFLKNSGTTGVACINTNRNYILIEKEQEYVDIINKRLNDNRTRQKI